MSNYKIVVDTREQKPLWNDRVISHKLEVGDYSIEGYEDKIAIERKSLSDLFGTLGKGHERFKRELEKALEYDYFAIVIDGSYSQCLHKDFPGAQHIRMSGATIIKILCTLSVKYGFRFYFTTGRVESRMLIKSLFDAFFILSTKSK